MKVIVSNIRLRDTQYASLPFECFPAKCEHAWEFHLWDMGDAYCRRCGSIATAENDPRVDRSNGHIVYLPDNGRRTHAAYCPGCAREKDLAGALATLSILWTNITTAGALCASFDLGAAAPAQRTGTRPWWPLCGRIAPSTKDLP